MSLSNNFNQTKSMFLYLSQGMYIRGFTKFGIKVLVDTKLVYVLRFDSKDTIYFIIFH